MQNVHAKNTVRYFILLIALLSFLFFSNDFGLIDVQKTAIVTAAGIDREGEGFILTSQVAVPQASSQGKATEAVQLVSRGKTIAEAFEEINAKTGWYPKLVFCQLILFGEDAAKENLFDGLDFFLRDAYLTDDCQVAVCHGLAKDLLNTSALIDSSSSAAISKVLSAHAERVGTVRPSSLKDFSIGYYGESSSGMLPVLKTEEQQEKIAGEKNAEGGSAGNAGEQQGGSSGEGGSQGGSGGQGGSSGEGGSQGGSGGSSGGQQGGKSGGEKPVFSAKETALFVRGRWRETLTAEETFALNAATGKLRLASYSVETEGETCTLLIKNNRPKIGLNVGKNGRSEVDIAITLVAGATDYSKAQALNEIKDVGSPPDGVFGAAEKRLAGALTTAYEKARAVGCDVLQLQERLVKYKRRKYLQHRSTLLDNTTLSVKIRFTNVR